ncbi:hypothetical protein [Alkalitalea saponilacus]|nr:hypothetical protein [Alkalitalea saponilacus]
MNNLELKELSVQEMKENNGGAFLTKAIILTCILLFASAQKAN